MDIIEKIAEEIYTIYIKRGPKKHEEIILKIVDNEKMSDFYKNMKIIKKEHKITRHSESVLLIDKMLLFY